METNPPRHGPLPPEKVRFLDVHVEPWPDGRRVRVHVEITRFDKPPTLEVIAENSKGETVAQVNIIETNAARLVFTIHLKDPEYQGEYVLKSRLYYPDLENVDHHRLIFQVNRA